MKNALLLLSVFCCCFLQAQVKDSVIDVPALVAQPNYTEHSTFYNGDLTHEVGYNDPHSVDEEFNYVLVLHFKSFDSIVDRKTYDLAADTALLKCEFGIISPWNWDMSPRLKITGTVSILGKSKSSIAAEEDILITDEFGRTFTFKASRSFSRVKPK